MRRALIAALSLVAATSMSFAEGVAIFPIKLLDTSHEARDQSADHERRRDIVAQVLASEIDDATILTTGDVADACAPETTDCLMELARDSGADRALLIVFQKTSTLIIQVFANVVDTETAQLIDSRSLNFRGDNDEAWARAGRFMAAQLQPH